MMRYVLLFAVNFSLMITLVFAASMLGLTGFVTYNASDDLQIVFKNLALFCLLMGFGAAFCSLFLSIFFARIFFRVKILTDHLNPTEKKLVDRVYHYANKAGLKKMPQVGYYRCLDPNAFATGRSKNHSLVAFSSGLLNNFNDDELDGVIAHEIAHIANGDMVTMTLLQGLINSIVIFVSMIITLILTSKSRDSQPSYLIRNGVYFIVSSILFTFGSLITCAFSRHREYRADHHGAMLAGKNKILATLKKLHEFEQQYSYKKRFANSRSYNTGQETSGADQSSSSLAYLQISGKSSSGFSLLRLFSTHPPLLNRINKINETFAG